MIEILAIVVVVLGLGLVAYVAMSRSGERKAEMAARLAAQAQQNLTIMEQSTSSLLRDEYVAQSEVDAWKQANTAAVRAAQQVQLASSLDSVSANVYRTLAQQLADPERTTRERNQAFVQRRMREDGHRFDRIERYPLTPRQREAIVTNQDTTLVIAGAGTGKTSTVVGKVEYLIRRGMASPAQILVVAFGKQAAGELRDRLSGLGISQDVTISTFHALGLRIVGEAEGRRPTLSRLAEDDRELSRFIRKHMRTTLETLDGQERLIRWFAEHLDEPEPARPEQTGDELIRAAEAHGLRDIRGTKMKSREEVRIANWLTLNGIAWEYERPYPVSLATPMHRDYLPDFYLSEADLYLEHFGINRDGSTAPNIDHARYTQAMAWKREVHQRYDTRLLETYSYQFKEGTVFTDLVRQLDAYGVTRQPLTPEQIEALMSEKNRGFSDFVNLLAQFLTVFKGNGGDLARLRQRAATERDRVFLEIFLPIFEAYEQELRSTQQIDFNDMINRAREQVQQGKFRGPYRYIIIDEFQDISANRLGLVQALRAQTPHGRLFVVGDDWQSIYRFTGSDIDIITNLPSRTGSTARVDLDTSFRYGQELLDVSSGFVTKNPAQLRKSLRAHEGKSESLPISLRLEPYQPGGPQHAGLEEALQEIANRQGGKSASIYILGRYNFSQPEDMEGLERRWAKKGLTVNFMTAHRSKGKEADYIIIVGLERGQYGFPSNVADDPVMKMVLSQADPYPYAEERRLFYVAMTRARKRVYVLAPQGNASTFVEDDLQQPPLNAFVEITGEVSERHRCPRCQGQTIRKRVGKFGEFWACTHYPLCHGRLSTCPFCKSGGLVRTQAATGGTIHQCTDCRRTVETCPRCQVGNLMLRNGRYGDFLACSEWNGGSGCTYTRNT